MNIIEDVPVPDPTNTRERSEASRRASERARELDRETGFDHQTRWDKEGSRYVIHRLAFEPPAEPWTETNRPPHRPPDWKLTPSVFVKLDELLIAAGSLKGYQYVGSHEFAPNPAQFVADLQVALDHQYGRGHFWATRHGHRISIQCRYPVEPKA